MAQFTSIQRRRIRNSGSMLRLLVTGTVSMLTALVAFGWYAKFQKDKSIYPVQIGTDGMAPTLVLGDVIMGESGSFQDTLPSRGDVIVFSTDHVLQLAKEKKGSFVVQRIAAISEDEVQMLSGRVMVNGVEFTTSTSKGVLHYDGSRHPGVRDQFTVPKGCVFTLGDNTSTSSDGRAWGFLPVEDILYRAWFCYWPPNRAGGIR
jgi:signal peptidase I